MKNLLKITFASLSLMTANLVFAIPVNVNSADAKKIADSLNGIGIKKAEAMVVYREQHGKFNSLDELTAVKGIGLKILEKNKADIQL